MATPQELLQKLEERFILGEITEETYKQLRASLVGRLGGQEAMGGRNQGGATQRGLVICSICHEATEPDNVFRCRKCGDPNICWRHQVGTRLCRECGNMMRSDELTDSEAMDLALGE
ncbi:MAG: hypothetical protein FJ291_29255 [Planctomycetes bacterium]|nr:hypothetical protein [Planctomycetota bacterium]